MADLEPLGEITELTRADISAAVNGNPRAIRALEAIQRLALRITPKNVEGANTTAEQGLADAAEAKDTANDALFDAAVAQAAAEDAQERADDAYDLAGTKQDADDALTALSSLPPDLGVLEQTAPDTFAIREVGAGSDDALLTRGDGDDRYAPIDTGTPWTAYSPTVTPASGAFGSITVSAAYQKVGKTVFLSISVLINVNGTAGGRVAISLPFATVRRAAFAAAEPTLNGHALFAGTNLSGTQMTVAKYDFSYPGGDGATLVVTGVYEAA